MSLCEEIKKIIPGYVKHTLSAEENGSVEEHLCVCDDCRKYVNDLLDIAETDKDKPQEAVRVALPPVQEDEQTPTVTQPKRSLDIVTIGTIILAIAIVVFVGLLALKR